jgi:hypothetical protein
VTLSSEHQRELFFAIPEPDLRVRQWIGDDERTGTTIIAYVPRTPPAPALDPIEAELLANVGDPAVRTVYADLLEQRGRTTWATYLREHEALRGHDAAAIQRARARLEMLVPTTELWWRRRVAITRLDSLEAASFALAGARFRYDTDSFELSMDELLTTFQQDRAALDPCTFDQTITFYVEGMRRAEPLHVYENARPVPVAEEALAFGPAILAFSIQSLWNDQIHIAETDESFVLFAWWTSA